MSIRVMTQVWDLDLTPATKLVMLKLADCADDQGRNAWPSVETIARSCSMSPRTVSRALLSLKTAGLIRVQTTSRYHASVTYEVHPEAAKRRVKLAPLRVRPDKLSSDTLAGRPAIHGTRDLPSTTSRPDKLADKPSMNRHREPSIEPSSPPNPLAGEPARVVRARNGSRRKRDIAALEQSGESRYFAGPYGQRLKARLEDAG